MRWTTPDFVEINLSGEVTAYANTDCEVRANEFELARKKPVVVVNDKSQQAST